MNATLLLEQQLAGYVTKEAQLRESIDQSVVDYYLGVGCSWPNRIMRLVWLPLSLCAPWFLMNYGEVPFWGVLVILFGLDHAYKANRKIAGLEATLELMELKKQFSLPSRADD